MGLSPTRSNFPAVAALIGSAHVLSHLYLLALPPLFEFLKAEFGASYAALGLLVTLFNLSSGAFQVPAGMVVDRNGARKVLFGGLALAGLGIALIGLAPNYWVILVLVIVAGAGNSVFHPADYSILSASVDEKHHGSAFSMHSLTGSLGFMVAPATMLGLSALMGWRGAMIVAGGLAAVVLLALVLFGRVLKDETPAAETVEPGGEIADEETQGLRPLLRPAVLTLFLFFFCTAMASSGVQSFTITALVAVQGASLGDAGTALTVYFAAVIAGTLLGGPLADRTRHHRLMTAVALGCAALLFFLIGAVGLPMVVLIVIFALNGLLMGAIRPARDMMVRAATPSGATGRVFAFVATALNIGGAVTPVLFGLLVDLGHARWVFVGMGVGLLLATGAIGLLRTYD